MGSFMSKIIQIWAKWYPVNVKCKVLDLLKSYVLNIQLLIIKHNYSNAIS